MDSIDQICSCGRDKFAGRELPGGYRLLGQIAKGGMGLIYRGIRIQDGALCAIKFSRWDRALQQMRNLEPREAKEEEKKRIHREVELLKKASQQSEHIVKILDTYREDPELGLFYPMEFLNGTPISKHPNWGKPWPPSRALELILQLTQGLGVVHGLGIVHRDINPDNIFIVQTEKNPEFIKIIDFGIARDLYQRKNLYQTDSQLAFGQLQYLAPEQIGYSAKDDKFDSSVTKRLDHRVDIYAVGVLLFQLLTGAPPFTDRTMAELVSRDWYYPPNLELAREKNLIPIALYEIIKSCLNPDPDDRPPDIFFLTEQLQSAARILSSSTPPPLPGPGDTSLPEFELITFEIPKVKTGIYPNNPSESVAEMSEVREKNSPIKTEETEESREFFKLLHNAPAFEEEVLPDSLELNNSELHSALLEDIVEVKEKNTYLNTPPRLKPISSPSLAQLPARSPKLEEVFKLAERESSYDRKLEKILFDGLDDDPSTDPSPHRKARVSSILKKISLFIGLAGLGLLTAWLLAAYVF